MRSAVPAFDDSTASLHFELRCGLERLAPGDRFALRLMQHTPATGNVGRLARFRFCF